MIRIKYTGRKRKIKEALLVANKVLENERFYLKIATHPPFDNAAISPSEISDLMKNYSQKITIKTYWNPFGANAGTNNGKTISVNTAKLRRTLKSRVNTFIHEYVHNVDFGTKLPHEELRFTHVDNENNGEENNTAPWKIGKISTEFI